MITNFLDLKKEPSNTPYLPPVIVDNIQKRMKISELTPLQEQAFNDERYWGDNNILIRGATSSGKTLIAEVAAARCIHHSQQAKNVIYLIPLKAMVSEKYVQFKQDMSDDNYDWDICASSADYQNFDEDILAGNFDVAVVVYEKFFAFLAQNNNDHFLRRCGLVIVDEIQMLSEIDRGAKLEFSIAKLLKDYNNIRIMGLTTIYCDTEALENWLKAELISNPKRTCDLHEYIVMTNGAYKAKFRDKNDETISNDVEGCISQYKGREQLRRRLDERKTEMTLALIKQEIQDGIVDNFVKIIVFAHSKKATERIAQEIRTSGILPERKIDQSLRAALGQQDDDDVISKMTLLIQHGVAYHNASLPQGTRMLIENKFEKGSIQVIVATATLAIGLNLPADVIILYDHTVKKDGIIKDIEAHAYKNYIGRAGRLGLSKRTGKSFLLTDTPGETNGCWDRYVNATPKEIDSVFSSLNAQDLASYYLNYIAGASNRTIVESDLSIFSSFTFGHTNSVEEAQKLVENILEQLTKWKLIEVSEEERAIQIEFGSDEGMPYQITSYGRSLAPFALPLRTCASIIIYFLQVTLKTSQIGGLPDGYNFDDLQNEKYLLDILYRVCLMDDIQKINFLQMPNTDQSSYRVIRNALKTYLAKIDESDGFWTNSPLAKFLDQPMDTQFETAAMRAIILLHWFHGELPREIKSKTSITLPLTIGDLDHLSEMCGYLLESISKCLPTRVEKTVGNNDKLMSAFHILSSRVKYGLELDLVRIKNKHISGVTRKSLILLSRDDALKNYESPVAFIQRASKEEWIRYFTPSQRDDILRTLDEPMIRGSVFSLAGKLLNDGLINESMKELLDTIGRPFEWEEWERQFKSLILQMNIDLKNTSYSGEYTYTYTTGKTFCFLFPQVEGDELLQLEDYNRFKVAVDNVLYQKVVIVCKNGFVSGVLNSFSKKDKEKIICLDSESFIGLICQCICVGNGDGKNLLISVLSDLSEEISRMSNNKLFGFVKNYAKREKHTRVESETTVYTLFDNSGDYEEIRSFQLACKSNGLFCETIRWGEDNLDYLSSVITSNKPVFVYFYDDISIQSHFIRYQIEAIINNDLLNNTERKLLILWKNEEIKASFEELYPYFHQRGTVKGSQTMGNIADLLKTTLEVKI